MLLSWSLVLSQNASPGGAHQVREQGVAVLVVGCVNVVDDAQDKLGSGCRVMGPAIGFHQDVWV
jgi:hypothetical protein